jgi:hypothetical protein
MQNAKVRKLKRYLALFMLACAAAIAAPETNYDQARVGTYTLPPLLVCGDGTTVTTKEQWNEKRRPELLELFQAHVYGRTPAGAPDVKFTVSDVTTDALNGLATRKLVNIALAGNPQWQGIDMMLFLPNGAAAAAPVFIGLSFSGNHAVTTETDVPISTRWMRSAPDKGVVNNRATKASRGVEGSRWPLETILKRGYAVATAYYGDIEPDRTDGWKDGVRAALSESGADTQWKNDDWGAIGAWSWGLSRMLDYCETDRAVDSRRAIVIGHSRLGKTALWTGARDERFALAISNNSGEGGAALARRNYGETIKDITTAFPHWFCPAYTSYSGRAADLPVDQHMLVALMAPRPVYIASAQDDKWADPRGEFLAGLHAGEAYALFGRSGLGTDEWPAADQPVGDLIGYHLRSGKHDLTAYDWDRYLEFANWHLPGRSGRLKEPAQR